MGQAWLHAYPLDTQRKIRAMNTLLVLSACCSLAAANSFLFVFFDGALRRPRWLAPWMAATWSTLALFMFLVGVAWHALASCWG